MFSRLPLCCGSPSGHFCMYKTGPTVGSKKSWKKKSQREAGMTILRTRKIQGKH